MESKILPAALLGLAVALLLQADLAAAGTTYVRWGRNVCPAGASVIYRGYIAGSHHHLYGSGSNLLCAHEEPTWAENNVPGMQDWAGRLAGAEYEVASDYPNNKPYLGTNARGANLHNRDALCVLCYVADSSTSFMLPGRQDCGEREKEFTLQYKGLLATEYHSRAARTEFICMDEAPQARVGSEADQNGVTLYPVQASCGSLPCPDYVEGNEITCAVCSI